MTTTPTLWKPTFFPNFAAPEGIQSAPQTIGLANGNILVVWEDDTQGPSPFTDVIGRIFNPEGNPMSSPFQVNLGIVDADETGPKIVAMPDGGYVVAFGSYNDALGGFITVERFDSNGQSVPAYLHIITDPRSSLTKWEITTDAAGNYTVVYEKQVSHSDRGDEVFSRDLFSVTYDAITNAPGPERVGVGQNSVKADKLGGIATLSSGLLVTFYSEPDYAINGNGAWTAEFTITNPLTGAVVRGATEIAGNPTLADVDQTDAFAMDVAALSGGKFVLLYGNYDPDVDTDLRFKICSGDGSASPIGSGIDIPGVGGFFDAQVVGLQDGGFFVVWNDLGGIRGQRFASDGQSIGDRMQIASDSSRSDEISLSLTADGRILVGFTDKNSEIAQVILDPRNHVIHGTDLNETITTQVDDTEIYGGGGFDVILGQGGNDLISGESGIDILKGGKGDDTYFLDDVTKLFAYDTVVEMISAGTDTVMVNAVLRPRGSEFPASYTLTDNVENATVTGNETFGLKGNALNNDLYGNDAANTIYGVKGLDALFGNGGDDILIGGVGNDAMTGGSGVDVLLGGVGDDTYVIDGAGEAQELAGEGFDHVRSWINYKLAANIESLRLIGQAIVAGGNDLDNTLMGNAENNRISGGLGKDMLTGDAGADDFIFNTALGAGNIDLVTDFAVGVDQVRLQNEVFTGLATGTLSAAAFHIGAAAMDASDRIIYNSKTGSLFFDPDGSGGAAQIRFAILDAGLALSNGDFDIA